MTSELTDRIWGRLGLSAVRAVPLEKPRAPSAEAAVAVTELRPRGAAWTAPSSWAAGLHHRCHAAAGGPAPRPADNSAALPRQGQLPDPADAPGCKRGQGGAHALLPQAGEARVSVGPRRNMVAAIRTKFEVALERSRFPESDWTVVGTAAACVLTAPSQQLADMPALPPPNEAGGCWKELPETLARRRPSGTLRTRTTARGRRAQQDRAEKDRELLGLPLLP